MNALEIVVLAVGAAGIGSALWFYYHLWKWARDCQQATVAIAFKRKVVMSPTLVELLLWSRKVPDGQNGQVFYRASGVTVAIVKRPRRTRWQRRRIAKNRPPRAASRAGVWDISQDKVKDEAS